MALFTLKALPSDVFFPQQAPVNGERVVMEALLVGQLVVDDGCLRVNAGSGGTSYLVVWPPDVRLHTANDTIELRTEAGQVVARVGSQVRFGGGEVKTAEQVELHAPLRAPLPDACPGLYWIVGEISPNPE